MSFDRKSVHGQTVSSKLSSGSTIATAAVGRDIPRPVTYNGQGDLSYINGSSQAAHAAKDMTHRPATGRRTPGAASIASSRNGSPGRNVRYYSNGGVGNGGGHLAAPQGNAGPTASAKSSSSSLKASNNGSRRQSWRHSHKSSGTSSFAQKLRSFAVFNWSAGGSNSSSNNNDHSPTPNHKDHISVLDDDHGIYADGRRHDFAPAAASTFAPGAGGGSGSGSGTLGGHAISSSSSSREQHDLKRNSCCPSRLPLSSSHSNGFSRRPTTDLHAQHGGPLANVHAALETISSPSYDFEMTKYVSTQRP
ncbi:hypothetical protein GGF44_001593 [Coemansia sp. RSA 1694]|nr:hypothetical protein GGF44_001593 [Coemansia sp. RSA 1694]